MPDSSENETQTQTQTQNEAETDFDVIVIGAGPVGENAADRAARTGARVALIEHELVGGECSYWACMPSKVLLRPGAALAAARAVPGLSKSLPQMPDVEATLASRDAITSGWDDASQVKWVQSVGVTLLRGHARIDGPRRIRLTGDDGEQTLTASYVVVATGSAAMVPDQLAAINPWTSREVTSADHIPESLAVIGGGVVATEMATAMADLGAHVTLLVRGPRLLPGTEEFAGEAVAKGLRDIGVDVRLQTTVEQATLTGEHKHLTLSDGTDLTVTEVLAATGRRPRTDDVGLDTIGLPTDQPLAVDDQGRCTATEGDWLYAVGDVTGRTTTTHQGKYDARIVGDVIATTYAGNSGEVRNAGAWSALRTTADDAAVPQVVFTRPEVASVGLTEAQARDAGYRTEVVHLPMRVAGASVTGDGDPGAVTVVIDGERKVILGVTFAGPNVAELLHAATIAIVGQVPLAKLWHAVPAYPTVSEIWLRVLEEHGL